MFSIIVPSYNRFCWESTIMIASSDFAPVSALTWQHIPFRQNEKLHGGITASSMLTRRHTPTCAGEWMRLRLCRKHVKKC